MATFVSNRDSDGLTNENGHFRLPLKALDGEIFSGLQVTQADTLGMRVKITKGDGKIPYQDYAYAFWMDADENITIPNASTTGARIDRLVAYIDRTMTFTASQINNPGLLKFKVISGVASANPVAPTDTIVQNSIGAGNPYINLAQITVPQNTTQIVNANIDMSKQVSMKLSKNIANPGVQTVDGTELRFMVIKEGDPLPQAIPNVTLIVFETNR